MNAANVASRREDCVPGRCDGTMIVVGDKRLKRCANIVFVFVEVGYTFAHINPFFVKIRQ
jgi:hypothetical protein